ncbi:MAG: hypothetical protein ACT4OM_09210 [Actinomycetota bacterium]
MANLKALVVNFSIWAGLVVTSAPGLPTAMPPSPLGIVEEALAEVNLDELSTADLIS